MHRQLSPAERDLLIRTVIGEAANQPPEGQAAVAHTVLNRLNSGKFGDSVTGIVLAPNQFEPWTTRAGELARISPQSKNYQSVGDIVDAVWGGHIPDPTRGATYFLQPETVLQRSGKLPDWAQGTGTKIAQHTFFNPDKDRSDVDSIFKAYNAPAPKEVPIDDIFKAYETVSEAPQIAQTKPQEIKEGAPGQFFTPNDGSMVPVPDTALTPEQRERQRVLNEQPRPGLASRVASDVISDFGKSWKQGVEGGASMIGEGVKDIAQGRSATGVGKVGLGGLGYLAAASGLTPAIEAGVVKPVERLTGSKETGERVGLLVPGTGLGKAAQAMRPEIQAAKDIIRDIGKENLPSVLSRLESNPNLTLMDVAPVVRGNAAGMANDPRNQAAMRTLTEFQRGRMADRPADTVNIFEDALGPTPNMAETVESLKQRARDTGKQLIEPAIEQAQPIPVKSVLKSIDRMIGSPEAIAGETPRIPLDPTQTRLLKLRNQITSGVESPLSERVKLSIDPINDALKTGGMSPERTADFTEARRLLNSARRGNTSEEELIAGLKDLAKKQKIVGPIDDALKMVTKGPTEYRSADFLHSLQSRLREEAQALSRSSSGAERLMGAQLFEARNKLINHIDKASGEKYKSGLKQYAEDKAIDEGFREGFNVFSNPSSAEAMIANHPDMWDKWLKNAPEAEKRAVALGILFGANNRALNMRRGLDVPENSFVHQRMASVMGKDNADEIVRRLQDWRDIAETDNLILKNSATALRQAGQKAREVREPRSGRGILESMAPASIVGLTAHMASGSPILSGAAMAGTVGGGKLLNMAGRAHDLASNKSYARWASATGQKKEDLLAMMREASNRTLPQSKAQKLINLLPAPLRAALPQ